MITNDYACWAEEEGEEDGSDISCLNHVDAAEWYAARYVQYTHMTRQQLSADGVRIYVRDWCSNESIPIRVKVSYEPTFHGARE